MSTGRPFIDITGNRYGRLLVLELAEYVITDPNDSQMRWKCLCDCGNTKVIRSYTLRKGKVQSCGCLSKERTPSNALPEGEAPRRKLYNDYKKQAKYRKLPFELSYDEFIALTSGRCSYCGRLPMSVVRTHNKRINSSYIFNGVDRQDNSKGYVKGNAVTCCDICNRAKKDLSWEDFMSWVYDIVEYNK